MISVCLFASHPLFTENLSQLLAQIEDFRIVSHPERFDVAVIDGELPTLDQLLSASQARQPAFRAVLLVRSVSADESLGWALRGVAGIVPYDRYRQDLSYAIREVAAGRNSLPAALRSRWELLQGQGACDDCPHLTMRESEVMSLAARGLRNKEIAAILHITERTVKMQMTGIRRKLGVRSRRQLRALRHLPARTA